MKMKRLISVVLALALVFGAFPAQAFAQEGTAGAGAVAVPPGMRETGYADPAYRNPFSDVSETDWYYQAVLDAMQSGLFAGTSTSTFSPDGTMTRAMYVTVMGRMAGISPHDYISSPFTDVSAGSWYGPYVAWAAAQGITSGVSDNLFDPDGLVNREQMATLTVRFFDVYHIPYPAQTISTLPGDLQEVSPYARDAVLKLWACGLLKGDSKGSFNPKNDATRAEAASFTGNAGRVVQAFLDGGMLTNPQEPQPLPENPAQGSNQTGGGSQSGGGNHSGGGTNTTYYQVTFRSPANASGSAMPEPKTYPAGTAITSLPTPYKQNTAFLGWYYDEDLTDAVTSGDKITKNTALYAKFADGATALSLQDTPNYMTIADVETDFTFQVKAASQAAVRSSLTIEDITANNSEIVYTISGDASPYTVSAAYAPGETYKAELAENSDTAFVYDGEQPESVRILNFITKMDEVLGLGLSGSIINIPKSSISNLTGETFDGLFNLSIQNGTLSSGKTGESGTFQYAGSDISVGDTVAIYSGTRPDQRGLATSGSSADGDIAYVTITGINGTTYSYTSSDAKDVLFTPDVLPVSKSADTDGNPEDLSITVAKSVLDFSDDRYASLNLDSQTTVDVGDFIAFFEGDFGAEAGSVVYGKITSVVVTGDNYMIGFTVVTQEAVYAAMDVYHTRNEDIDLTEAQIAAIERDMEAQAIASGFIDDAAQYLTGLAMHTDGFQELASDMTLKSLSISGADGKDYGEAGFSLFGASRTQITKKEVEAKIAAGKVLQHFDGSSGIRAELALTFTVEVSPSAGSDNKLEITVQAIFEQEVLLSVNVKGGAIWKKAWIFPYIYDYRLNANFDVGTYTGIGITATAKTVGGDDAADFDWKPASGNKAEQKIINIGKQITDLMDKKEEFLGEKLIDEDGEEMEWSGSNGGGLAEKYAAMIEASDESWIEIFRKEIFSIEGSVDPFHILVFGISADFVVSANMYVTMGMTFEYGNAKRYNYSLMLFHKKSTNETIDLEPAHYQFDFYVMGTMGVRAGIELEVAVGLFSLRLDSIGITAEVGAYAQLWGYFYYHYRWEKGTGGAPTIRESSSSGAMLIEIGIYLKITFKAQLFSSKKLTYQPTLLDKKWPLLTIGSVENVFDFGYAQDDAPSFDIKAVKTFTLPASLFDMRYMDMQTGEIFGGDGADSDHPARNYDDATESRFIIELTNSAFRYNPATNEITVVPGASSMKESGDMAIVWKNGTLAFTSKPISRTIKLTWEDPASGRYISFDSAGGSPVNMVFAKEGAAIAKPANPSKQGYEFGGWYSDRNFAAPFEFPSVMPDYPQPSRGVTVYAKWIPAQNAYKVEHYFQGLDGYYTLDASYTQVLRDKKTEETTAAKASAVTGFTAKPIAQSVVAASGSTVVKIYYDRAKYALTFTYGEFASADNADIIYTYKYGADIYAPRLAIGGYIFDGWNAVVQGTMPASDLAYAAKWKADPNTPYRVEHYFQNANGIGYTYVSMESKTGATDSTVQVAGLTKASEGMLFKRATVDGNEVTTAKIRPYGTLVIKLFYDRNAFDVTFDSKGGSAVAKLSQIRFGASVSRPASNPTKTGYAFGGWYKDDACSEGRAFDFAFDKMPAEALTLYAKWIGSSYLVTFDANGGSGTTPAQDFVYGIGQALAPNGFSKAGHTFIGWNTKADGSGLSYTDCAVVSDLTFESGINLYAQWMLNSYHVEFHANGGSGKVEEQAFDYDEIKNLSPNMYVKSGYAFAGWATDADGPVVYSDEEVVRNLSTANGVTVHIYARWIANSYQVIFNGNGAGVTGTMPAQSFVYDEEAKALEANRYVRNGYAFAGWNTKADGSGISYADLAKVSNLAEGSAVNLYALWTAGGYTLTLDDQGGGGGSGSVSAVYGDALTKVSAPSKAGYDFVGYYDGKNGAGTQYYKADGTGATSWNKAADATLYAHWTKGVFTVHFNAGGGTVSQSDKQVTFGSAYGELPTPLLEGYTFTGWFTAVAEGVAVTSGTTVDITEAQTLHARWTVNTYTVRYNGNGSGVTGTMVNQDFMYDEAAKALSPNGFLRTGYAFAGWAVSASGAIQYADGAAVRNLTAEQDKTVDLYAVWNVNHYAVHFDGNGNTGGSMDNQTFAYGESKALSANAFTRAGYTFAGWAISPAGSAMYSNSMSVSNLSSSDAAIVTLYATWNAGAGIEYRVKHWQQNKEGDGYTEVPASVQVFTGITGHATAATANSYTGFAAIAIVQGTIAGDGSTVVNVYYDRIVRYAVWNTTGGSSIANIPYRFGQIVSTPAAPVRAGYKFTGWTWNGNDIPKKNIPSTVTMGTADSTFTAVWSAVTYTIQFNAGGGSAVASQTIGYNSKVARPGNPSKTGFSFDGWYSDVLCTVSYDFNSIVTGNLTLYAKWDIVKYDVTFHANGGSEVGLQQVVHGGKVSVPDPAPAKSGYGLDGWYTEEACNNVYDFNEPVTANLSLYAKWSVLRLEVSFNTNGGSSVAGQVLDYGNKVSVPVPQPVKVGYGFSGWYTSESFEAAYDFNTPVTEDFALYAKWNPIGYSVAFNKNGESVTGAMNGQAFIYGESGPLTVNGFSKDGYSFNGWNTKADGTGASYADAAIVSNLASEDGKIVTLYAKWQPNRYTIQFNGNGNTGGSMTDQSFTYDVQQNLSVNGFVKTGSEFAGWSASADGTGASYAPGQAVMNLLDEDGASVTLYAKWTVKQYTITFKSDSNTVYHTVTGAYGTAVVKPADPKKAGYNFSKWSQPVPAAMPAGDLTLIAEWNVVSWFIDYNLNGGTNAAGNPVRYTVEEVITLAHPTRAGEWSFAGWTGTDLAAKTKDVTIALGSTGNRTYTANWEVRKYPVRVVSKDGEEYVLNVERDSKILASNPIEGSTVLGLYSDAGFSKDLNGEYWVKGTAGETIYARLSSEEHPCPIENAEDWNLFKSRMSGAYPSWRTAHFKLVKADGSPVSLALNGWQESIGSSSIPFKGTFDGNGIGGSEIVFGGSGPSGYSTAGLFAELGTGGVVKNVRMTGELRGINSAYSSFGTVTAKNTGTIKNCTFTGLIEIATAGSKPAGGLAGENGGTIEGCSLGAGTAINGSTTSNIGGIAGKNVNGGTITGDVAFGDVLVIGGESTGGIVGRNELGGQLIGEKQLSAITVIGGKFTGGIAGHNNGIISGWSIANSLIKSESGSEQIGGIAGHNENAITDCELVDSSVTSIDAGGSLAGSSIGGIAGENLFGHISSCSVSGKKDGEMYTVSGYSSIGGIAGVNGTSTDFNATLVNGSVSGASLFGTRNYGGAGGNVGGIAGTLLSGTVSGWNVSATAIKANLIAGGCAGYVTTSAMKYLEVVDCMIQESVTVLVPTGNAAFAGTLIGNMPSPSPHLTWLKNCASSAAIQEF